MVRQKGDYRNYHQCCCNTANILLLLLEKREFLGTSEDPQHHCLTFALNYRKLLGRAALRAGEQVSAAFALFRRWCRTKLPLALWAFPPTGTCWGGQRSIGLLAYTVPKTQLGPRTPQLEPSRRKIKAWSCGYREDPQTCRL